MVQWPFRTAGINAPSPTAPALAPPRKRVCYWLTRLKRHLGGMLHLAEILSTWDTSNRPQNLKFWPMNEFAGPATSNCMNRRGALSSAGVERQRGL
jgi:hypothetical protein